MNAFATALISAATSVVVVVITHTLSVQWEIRRTRRAERDVVKSGYLNPLRLYLVESHFRLSKIMRAIADSDSGECAMLLAVDAPASLSAKDADWYNGLGAYLVSSAYLTACLFAWMKKVGDNLPYLRLGRDDDTRLTALMLRVSLGFLHSQGIYYVIQRSIGQDMLMQPEGRVASYREFCELLCTPSKRVWMDRLITYYLETGRGQNLERVAEAVGAIANLSAFLDAATGGGRSIMSRFEAEGIT